MANSIKDFLHGIKQNWGKNKFLIWFLGLAGVVLLLLPNFFAPRQTPPPAPKITHTNYQQQLQEELESILSGIAGVGKVRVMLTLDDEQEVVYARNREVSRRTTREEDNQGGVRDQVEYDERGQLVIVRTSNQEEPVIEKIIRPRVRGVLVVAAGADDPRVRETLLRAVQRVLAVPLHMITIEKVR